MKRHTPGWAACVHEKRLKHTSKKDENDLNKVKIVEYSKNTDEIEIDILLDTVQEAIKQNMKRLGLAHKTKTKTQWITKATESKTSWECTLNLESIQVASIIPDYEKCDTLIILLNSDAILVRLFNSADLDKPHEGADAEISSKENNMIQKVLGDTENITKMNFSSASCSYLQFRCNKQGNLINRNDGEKLDNFVYELGLSPQNGTPFTTGTTAQPFGSINTVESHVRISANDFIQELYGDTEDNPFKSKQLQHLQDIDAIITRIGRLQFQPINKPYLEC